MNDLQKILHNIINPQDTSCKGYSNHFVDQETFWSRAAPTVLVRSGCHVGPPARHAAVSARPPACRPARDRVSPLDSAT